MKKHKLNLILLLSFLAICLLISFLYEPVLSNWMTVRVPSLKSQDGLSFPPYSPNMVKPFGTDLVGFTLLSKLIQGFKYTFIIVFFLSLAQLTISFIISSFTFKYQKKRWVGYVLTYLDKLLTLFPKPFLLLLLIIPIYFTTIFNTEPNPSSNQVLLIKQLIVLLLISLPNLIQLFHNELIYLFQTDYAKASLVLGSTPRRMMLVALRPQLTILSFALFFKTVTQNLALFVYLAYFNYFLGGTLLIELDLDTQYYLPLSNEWSGIIGQNIQYLTVTPWTLLIPMTAYCLFIFIVSQINQNLKSILTGVEANEII